MKVYGTTTEKCQILGRDARFPAIGVRSRHSSSAVARFSPRPRAPGAMDVEELLREPDDDLADFDLSQGGVSQDLVDYEEMTPVPSPAKPKPTGEDDARPGVPTAGATGEEAGEDEDLLALEAEIDAAAAEAGTPGGGGVSPSPPAARKRARDEAQAMDADATDEAADEEGMIVVPAAETGDVDPPAPAAAAPNPDPPSSADAQDSEMRDQHTFVPLEPDEVRLVERICRAVREPKKHLVRLLVKQFGAALAEGALAETRRVEKSGGSFFEWAPGKPPRRRSPGGVFIWVMKSRAPEADFKRVMRRSLEIDKLLKKQKEEQHPRAPQPRPRPRPREEVAKRGEEGSAAKRPKRAEDGERDPERGGGVGGGGGGRGDDRSRFSRGEFAGENARTRVNEAYATDV